MERTKPSERSPVVSLCDVRRARQQEPAAGFPDLAAIAREPSYVLRRRKLADAVKVVSGSEPDARILDHQMILLGLAAGHGCEPGGTEEGEPWPLGSGFADPAVVVGLVLHHARHSARRGLPIPKSLLSALDHHVAAGSAAARLVRDWLEARSVPCGKRRLWVHKGGKA
jgi:hypothetical protein